MGDYEERAQFGEIYVELSALSSQGAQVRFGDSSAGSLFETQLCDASGVFDGIGETSEIAIGVTSAQRARDLAAAFGWLAKTLEARLPSGPRPPRRDD